MLGQHVLSIPAFLSRLHEHDLKVSPSRAITGATQVTFPGHFISSSGVRPDPEKLKALDNMSMATDVS